jgi:L-lactate utilization protein LutC
MTAETLQNDFSTLATEAQIESVMKSLEANNIHVQVAASGPDARKMALEMIPPTAEVFTSSSVTLQILGITDEMDPKTQSREMQKMGATPEYMIGSVHAVTETGQVLIASKTGSQLAGYVSAAAHVIWVVGTQKIVPTLEDGMRRLEEYTLPLENVRSQKAYGVNSSINKLLIVNREFTPGRTTMILVKENVGY